MPIATKRKTEARKEAPIIEPASEPRPQAEEQPPAPKVTALIFSYDSAPALRRCLAALEGSKDRAAIEILVVDCGSHDESPQLDSEFPQVTILRLPRYFGRTKAINIGTRTAAGEHLFVMTPEVEVLPTTVPALLARLESDAEAVAVAPLLLDTGSKPAAQFFRLPTPQTGTVLIPVDVDKSAEAVSVEYATFQALLVRKYFVKGINFLDERYGEFGADAELCYQIRRAGRKLLALPQVTALYTPCSPYSEAAETILAADRVHGAAVYFVKHYGFLTGLMFRIKSALGALFTGRLGLFAALVSGSKIDGSQTAIL
ncbi:MAG TPA: glycosyltransferase [Bryobacteraceae bacterium]|nr:glycosyltransferase [Bryobacteraceae bacterium]